MACVKLIRSGISLVAVLALVLTGCKTPQAHTTVPNPDFAYSFNKAPFINPRIIQELSTWISDHGDQVVAINVLEAQSSNRYFGEAEVKNVPGQNPVVCHEVITVQGNETNQNTFSYQYVGRTDSGIDVLLTSDWGGGSGVFKNLLLVKFEYDTSIICDLEKGAVQSGKRLLIKKVGEIGLGDRWQGELGVKGDSIFVGKDKGWFAGTEKGGGLSAVPKDRWLKIDLETPSPKTKAKPATKPD